MRTYKVPVELDEEEKVIGGVFTLRQIGYIATLGGIGMIVGFILPIHIFGVALITVILGMIGAALGFLKVNIGRESKSIDMDQGINIDTFLFQWVRFKFTPKTLIYRRGKYKWR